MLFILREKKIEGLKDENGSLIFHVNIRLMHSAQKGTQKI